MTGPCSRTIDALFAAMAVSALLSFPAPLLAPSAAAKEVCDDQGNCITLPDPPAPPPPAEPPAPSTGTAPSPPPQE